MVEAALRALSQMFTAPFRAVLLKSAGLALALLAIVIIVLFRLLDWLSHAGMNWLESTIGPIAHTPILVLDWIVAITVGVGLFSGAVMLMPAVTSLVASFFVDEVAALVEAAYYPSDPPGTALPLWFAVSEGLKAALLAILIYACATPFLLFAGAGVVLFFVATAWLQGKIYFELAAARFHPLAEAKALRRDNRAMVFIAGLLIAAFVSVPFLNLATPLFGTALMVHLHKRLVGRRLPRIERSVRDGQRWAEPANR
jgi:CysZ protein